MIITTLDFPFLLLLKRKPPNKKIANLLRSTHHEISYFPKNLCDEICADLSPLKVRNAHKIISKDHVIMIRAGYSCHYIFHYCYLLST